MSVLRKATEILADVGAEEKSPAVPHSALMAVRALLGVEVLRRYTEHTVALDADAVQHCLRLLWGTVSVRL